MVDNFHETYPEVGFRLMIHFNHPDEFLLKGVRWCVPREPERLTQVA